MNFFAVLKHIFDALAYGIGADVLCVGIAAGIAQAAAKISGKRWRIIIEEAPRKAQSPADEKAVDCDG